jgi:hypothetical protein
MLGGTTSSKKGKKTQLPQNDQEFADFEDDREGIQGNSELYDYGEDFDCGNETTSSKNYIFHTFLSYIYIK